MSPPIIPLREKIGNYDYDTKNKRTKQIDLDRPHDKVSPHTHHGYIHSENDSAKGYANLTTEEKKMVERARKIWYNRHSK